MLIPPGCPETAKDTPAMDEVDQHERFVAEEKPPGFVDHLIWSIVRGVLATWVIYGVMAAGGWISLANKPEGTSYVLLPRGWGLVADITWWIVVVSLCSVIYSLPALVVRNHIGCLVRLCTVLIFVVVVTKFQSDNCIAVVEQPDTLVFLKRFPMPQRRLAKDELGDLRVYRYRLTVAIELRVAPLDYLRCTSVWRNDPETMKIQDRLQTVLHRRP